MFRRLVSWRLVFGRLMFVRLMFKWLIFRRLVSRWTLFGRLIFRWADVLDSSMAAAEQDRPVGWLSGGSQDRRDPLDHLREFGALSMPGYASGLPCETGSAGWATRGPSYRGTSLIGNSPLSWGHHRALGRVLLKGPRGRLFLMSEVPL